MIDAVKRAEERLNRGRRKPLTIEAQFIFVDQNASATEHLQAALDQTGLRDAVSGRIDVRTADASSSMPDLVQSAKAWSKKGRSIFLLDQCGYTDAPHRDVRLIYQELPKSEVIVTYAFGALYDYMTDRSEFLAALAPIELSPEHLRELLRSKQLKAGRYFAGRLLGRHLQHRVGSQYASRFFLHSERSDRDMWLVHYSKVLRSRLAMSEAHWSVQNSITQGEAGLDMVGFRPQWENQLSFDFGFDESDAGRMHTALMRDLPRWLDQFEVGDAPTFDAMLSLLADGTAATENQFREALSALLQEDEVEVLTPSGANKRQDTLIHPSHRIRLPRQRRLIL